MKKKFADLYKNIYVIFFTSLLLSVLVYVFSGTTLFQDVELRFTDARFHLKDHSLPDGSEIVIVSIDDGSLDFFQQNGISWPWPRDYYGFVVNYLSEVGAKAVIFDMQFYENDIDREETFAFETDGIFADALQKADNVFLAIQMLQAKTELDSTIYRFALQNAVITDKENLSENLGVRAPIPILLNSAKSVGAVDILPDNDGVIRRAPMFVNLNGNLFPQIALSAWLNNTSDNNVSISGKNAVINDTRIPTDKDGNLLLNWYTSSEGKSPFRTYPFQAVIASGYSKMNESEPLIQHNEFKDKYVIIGATAAGLLDLKTNPYSINMPGSEVWATALSNLLNEDFIIAASGVINLLLCFLISFSVLLAISHLKPLSANLIAVLLFVVILLLNIGLWNFYSILLNFSAMIFCFILSYLLITTVGYLSEGKSKRQIRKIFSRYLHEDVIKQLEEDPNRVQLGGKEIEATVLYTDIYDFTTISETKTPKELVKDLNEYFEELTGNVLDYKGLLDKYTGDGIMAIFGAPLTRKDHAVLACKAAFAHKNLREKLKKKVTNSAPEEFHIQTRTGINSGLLVAGNIGSTKRMDYTAIGDTVNLAARLEGVNKIYKTNIIISEATYKHVEDIFLCRELDYLRVKGKNEPTRIYELIDEIDNEKDYQWLTKYAEAVRFYREGSWKIAIKMFQELTEEPVNDSASQVMLDRCMYLKKNPPENWNGILTLEVK